MSRSASDARSRARPRGPPINTTRIVNSSCHD
jgi:hypothetical protein